jgi:hypothetical protein
MKFTLLYALCLTSFAVTMNAAPTSIIEMPKDLVNYDDYNFNMTRKFYNTTKNSTRSKVIIPPCLNASNHTNTCDMCMSFVNELRDLLEKGNTTIIPLNHWISMICHDIYGPSAKECYNITHATDMIIQDILHNSSKTVCHQMKQC